MNKDEEAKTEQDEEQKIEEAKARNNVWPSVIGAARRPNDDGRIRDSSGNVLG